VFNRNGASSLLASSDQVVTGWTLFNRILGVLHLHDCWYSHLDVLPSHEVAVRTSWNTVLYRIDNYTRFTHILYMVLVRTSWNPVILWHIPCCICILYIDIHIYIYMYIYMYIYQLVYIILRFNHVESLQHFGNITTYHMVTHSVYIYTYIVYVYIYIHTWDITSITYVYITYI
jgi:hypothetical protein